METRKVFFREGAGRDGVCVRSLESMGAVRVCGTLFFTAGVRSVIFFVFWLAGVEGPTSAFRARPRGLRCSERRVSERV